MDFTAFRQNLLITMRNDGNQSIFICPASLTEFFKSHGVFPFEADQFFSDFEKYLSKSISAHTSYPYGEKFYADIGEVMDDIDGFVLMVRNMIETIYYKD